jgi:hypothetical protein
MKIPAIVTMLSILLVEAAPVQAKGSGAGGPPTVVGTCRMTRIKQVTQRLEEGDTGKAVANSGSTVVLANGVYGVSYDQVAAVNRSRAGDPVRTCLVSIPQDCPPGDERGREYKTINLRTHQSWTLPDAEHMCGGA